MKTAADNHNSAACKICKKPAVSFHYGACDDCTKAAIDRYVKWLGFVDRAIGPPD